MVPSRNMKKMFYTALVMLLAISSCFADIYTSSKRIVDMVLKEQHLLDSILADLTSAGDENLPVFDRFYQDRLLRIQTRKTEIGNLGAYLKHPNGVYHIINEFAREYKKLRDAIASTSSQIVWNRLSNVANEDDVEGAKMSFIRLQDVYGFSASDIVKGDYKGFKGPTLDAMDSLLIGRAAFSSQKYEFAKEWLETALQQKKDTSPSGIHGGVDSEPYWADIESLLGRVKVRTGQKDEARAIYKRCLGLPSISGDVEALGMDLGSVWPEYKPPPRGSDGNFSRLCSLQSNLHNDIKNRRLKCKYRVIRPAYNRFKMELLSISPYVALFHEIITDQEIDGMLEEADENMYRAQFQGNSGVGRTKGDFRVSDTGFLYDDDSVLIERIGKRVSLITGLNTSQPGRFKFAGEPIQVVNYGMGGHYGIHMDAFVESLKTGAHANGNRVATFLMYLTDVEKGGSTAFTELELVVPPTRKSAVFWYSMLPSGDVDNRTLHAGCPVIIGHKWVANKWIWTLGNTFARRCGLKHNSTQLSIEKHMLNGWK